MGTGLTPATAAPRRHFGHKTSFCSADNMDTSCTTIPYANGISILLKATPFYFLMVGNRGFEPPQPYDNRFTVCRDSPSSPITQIWYRWWDSNPHGAHAPTDFKSVASTNSATPINGWGDRI